MERRCNVKVDVEPIMSLDDLKIRKAALEEAIVFLKEKHIRERSEQGELLTEFMDRIVKKIIKSV